MKIKNQVPITISKSIQPKNLKLLTKTLTLTLSTGILILQVKLVLVNPKGNPKGKSNMK